MMIILLAFVLIPLSICSVYSWTKLRDLFKSAINAQKLFIRFDLFRSERVVNRFIKLFVRVGIVSDELRLHYICSIYRIVVRHCRTTM